MECRCSHLGEPGGLCAFAVQLIVLLLVSVKLYDRYDLTRDFAIYQQSWWLIAHGHLNPFDSVDGFPFIKSHFELIMWPLSLLYWVHHSGVTLLWVQDVALVGRGSRGLSMGP